MLVHGPQDPASRCLRKLWLDSKLWLAILHLSVTSRELIRHLESDGWRRVRVKGSHHHFGHPTKKGIVTVRHPTRDYPIGTLKSIERQSGMKLR